MTKEEDMAEPHPLEVIEEETLQRLQTLDVLALELSLKSLHEMYVVEKGRQPDDPPTRVETPESSLSEEEKSQDAADGIEMRRGEDGKWIVIEQVQEFWVERVSFLSTLGRLLRSL